MKHAAVVPRVAFVTQWYPPEPTDIPASIAEALSRENLSVEVLTGVPNYPDGVVQDGYSVWRPGVELRDGLRVRRTPLYPSHDSSAVKRLLNYASFAVSTALTGQRALRRADVCLVYSSPATSAVPAMVARFLWRTQYVLLVQDVWPDSVFASGFLPGRKGRMVERLLTRFVDATYAMAAHVAVISPGMKTLLESRGVPADKVSLVYNWLPDSETAAESSVSGPRLRETLGIGDAPLFIYAGNHGHAQALHTVVEAFVRPESGDAHLVLLGDGVTKADLRALAGGAERVHFLDPVPRTEAAALTRQADFHVVSLADQPLFTVTMPSKVQSGLAAGVPMLVVCRGDAADVVESSGAGIGAVPGDVPSVVTGVRRLSELDHTVRATMGRAGADLYATQMSREIGAAQLAGILRRAGAAIRREGAQ